MDFYLHLENLKLADEKLNTFEILFLYSKEALFLTLNVLNNVTFILLFIYIRRRKSRENWKKTEFDNFHAPIFNQLYYISGLSLIFYDISYATRLMGDNKEYTVSEGILVVMSTFSVIVCSFLFGSIIGFSFLAVLQRILILYRPTYKWLVTGSNLSLIILIVYVQMLYYAWLNLYAMRKRGFTSDYSDILLLIYNCILLTMTLLNGAFYYHVFQLLQKLSSDAISAKANLLFQFLPIFGVSVIYIFTICLKIIVRSIWKKRSVIDTAVEYIIAFLPHFTPVIISLSYTASMDKLRAVVYAILHPETTRASSI